MRYLHLALWSVILGTAVNGQNWEIGPILGRPAAFSIATDTLCLPRVAFAGGRRLGYATKNGTVWEIEYPDSSPSSGFSQVELCLDGADVAHIAYVLSGWPEPSELRYARRAGDTWWVDTVVGGAPPGSLTLLGPLALARDGTPHIMFVDSLDAVRYARKAGDTWGILTVPAYQADSLRRLGGASLALDSNGQPGVGVTWIKYAVPRDSLWLSFFKYDGQDWHRFDVDSTQGWAPWDFWPVRVRYDPTSDLFHVVYRAYRYATGKDGNWQVEEADVSVGNVYCDFVLHQGRPHIACASTWDPVTYQWRGAGGWETEMVITKNADAMSVAVDRTGRPHVSFASAVDETLYYARRLFVGTEEPPTMAQPAAQLIVYPNPVTHTLTVELTTLRRTTTSITLTDASGRAVWSRKENLLPGSHRRRISLPASVSPGVYFCTLETGFFRISRKVVLAD